MALTPCDIDEVFSSCLVDLNVSLAKMVFVFSERQISRFFVFKSDQSFAISPALLTQTQCYTTPVETQKKHTKSQNDVDWNTLANTTGSTICILHAN